MGENMRDHLLKEKITHGTPIQPVNALHFEVGKNAPDGDVFFVENHWHDYVEFIVVRKGSYQIRINLETVSLHEGDICIFNSGDLHQITSMEEEDCHDAFLFDPAILGFHYQDQWNQEVIGPFVNHALLCANMIHPGQERYEKLLAAMDELFAITYSRGDFWYERCKLKLLECLLGLQAGGYLVSADEAFSSAEQIQIERYKKIVNYIESHYQEPLSLERLAEQIPCNSQYLCRFFKKISGETPIQYLIKYRVQQSCFMLKETRKSISEIALDCGFDNISYYIRKFKEIQGETPGEYRKEHSHKKERF